MSLQREQVALTLLLVDRNGRKKPSLPQNGEAIMELQLGEWFDFAQGVYSVALMDVDGGFEAGSAEVHPDNLRRL